MKIGDGNLFKILVTYFFPFLINTFEFRTEEEISTMVKTEEVFEDEVDDSDEDEENGVVGNAGRYMSF